MCHDLSAEPLHRLLRTRSFGRVCHLQECIDSTNSEAARLAAQGAAHGTLVWADQQTAGRGRRGRTWYAQAGRSLCFSVVLRPTVHHAVNSQWLGWIPLAAALGVANGIQRLTGLTPTLKWPNDLLLQEKKCGGLLCEHLNTADRSPLLIVGVGLNVNEQEIHLPEELRAGVTSLAIQCHKHLDRAEVLGYVLNEMEPCLEAVCHQDLSPIRAAYRRACGTIGRLVRVERQGHPPLEGRVQTVTDSGALQIHLVDHSSVEFRTNVVEVLAGDVVHLRPLMVQ